MMPGVVTITEQTHKMIKKVTFDWTTTSTGGLWGHPTVNNYDGEVLGVVNMKNTSTGTWTLQIDDDDGIDLLGGQGSDTMTSGAIDFGTKTSTGLSEMPLSVVSGKLNLIILSGSSGSTGQTIVYIR
ncbi:hypothetical protein ES703_18095 [subsurface metagenome]